MNVTDVVIVWRLFYTRLSYIFTRHLETDTMNMKFEQGFWGTQGTLTIFFLDETRGNNNNNNTYIAPISILLFSSALSAQR